MKQEERWKKEFEQYKADLIYLRNALDRVRETGEEEQVLRQLLLGGVMQGFCAVLYRSGMVMNEYMAERGQGRIKTLKNIFAKALKLGLIVHKRWVEVENELNDIPKIETLQDALKMEKKIRRVYLPLLERFERDMDLQSQPTLFG